jgi:hypothetical protein
MKLTKYLNIGLLTCVLGGCSVVAPVVSTNPNMTTTKTTTQVPVIVVPSVYPIVNPNGVITGYFYHFGATKNYITDKQSKLIVYIVANGNKADLYNKDPKDGGKLIGSVPLSTFNLMHISKKK